MTTLVAKKEVFSNLINAVLPVNKEAVVKVTTEGIFCNVGSLDHTAAAFITLPKALFDSYDVPSNIEFGLKFEEFKKRLSRCGKITKLDITEDVKIESDDKKYGFALFGVKAFNAEPKIEFACKFSIKQEDLKRVLGDVEVVSGAVTLKSDGKIVSFMGKGDIAADNVSVSPAVTNLAGEAESKYSLTDYLRPMAEAVAGDEVSIEFGSKQPLRMKLGNVVYFLGARVNEVTMK